jgi:hypothetical protein
MRPQTPLAWFVMFGIAAVMLGTAWMFRYSVTAENGNSYRLDRWTGNIQRCTSVACYDVR